MVILVKRRLKWVFPLFLCAIALYPVLELFTSTEPPLSKEFHNRPESFSENVIETPKNENGLRGGPWNDFDMYGDDEVYMSQNIDNEINEDQNMDNENDLIQNYQEVIPPMMKEFQHQQDSKLDSRINEKTEESFPKIGEYQDSNVFDLTKNNLVSVDTPAENLHIEKTDEMAAKDTASNNNILESAASKIEQKLEPEFKTGWNDELLVNSYIQSNSKRIPYLEKFPTDGKSPVIMQLNDDSNPHFSMLENFQDNGSNKVLPIDMPNPGELEYKQWKDAYLAGQDMPKSEARFVQEPVKPLEIPKLEDGLNSPTNILAEVQVQNKENNPMPLVNDATVLNEEHNLSFIKETKVYNGLEIADEKVNQINGPHAELNRNQVEPQITDENHVRNYADPVKTMVIQLPSEKLQNKLLSNNLNPETLPIEAEKESSINNVNDNDNYSNFVRTMIIQEPYQTLQNEKLLNGTHFNNLLKEPGIGQQINNVNVIENESNMPETLALQDVQRNEEPSKDENFEIQVNQPIIIRPDNSIINIANDFNLTDKTVKQQPPEFSQNEEQLHSLLDIEPQKFDENPLENYAHIVKKMEIQPAYETDQREEILSNNVKTVALLNEPEVESSINNVNYNGHYLNVDETLVIQEPYQILNNERLGDQHFYTMIKGPGVGQEINNVIKDDPNFLETLASQEAQRNEELFVDNNFDIQVNEPSIRQQNNITDVTNESIFVDDIEKQQLPEYPQNEQLKYLLDNVKDGNYVIKESSLVEENVMQPFLDTRQDDKELEILVNGPQTETLEDEENGKVLSNTDREIPDNGIKIEALSDYLNRVTNMSNIAQEIVIQASETLNNEPKLISSNVHVLKEQPQLGLSVSGEKLTGNYSNLMENSLIQQSSEILIQTHENESKNDSNLLEKEFKEPFLESISIEFKEQIPESVPNEEQFPEYLLRESQINPSVFNENSNKKDSPSVYNERESLSRSNQEINFQKELQIVSSALDDEQADNDMKIEQENILELNRQEQETNLNLNIQEANLNEQQNQVAYRIEI